MIFRVNENGTLKTFSILDNSVIANAFNNAESYEIGDYVFHGNKIYRFTSAHSAGAWDSTEVTEVTIADEIIDAKNSGGNGGASVTVDVSGASPTITAEAGVRYVCGEVTSISFTPSVSGICNVRFTSGSTVAVLTVPNTVKFPAWFDSTTLEPDTVYEISIEDGVYGAVMTW